MDVQIRSIRAKIKGLALELHDMKQHIKKISKPSAVNDYKNQIRNLSKIHRLHLIAYALASGKNPSNFDTLNLKPNDISDIRHILRLVYWNKRTPRGGLCCGLWSEEDVKMALENYENWKKYIPSSKKPKISSTIPTPITLSDEQLKEAAEEGRRLRIEIEKFIKSCKI